MQELTAQSELTNSDKDKVKRVSIRVDSNPPIAASASAPMALVVPSAPPASASPAAATAPAPAATGAATAAPAAPSGANGSPAAPAENTPTSPGKVSPLANMSKEQIEAYKKLALAKYEQQRQTNDTIRKVAITVGQSATGAESLRSILTIFFFF